ncbi:MAG: choice-of-anchor D domain-containing protein [Candidatus Cloacimonadaceae bacterium]
MRKPLFLIFMLAIFLGQFIGLSALTIQIGSGSSTTSSFPIVSSWGYTYSQQIYTKAQIDAAGGGAFPITALRFYNTTGSTTNSSDWVVYMGHTTKTSFTSGTDWVPLASLTQVFNGTVSFSTGWMEIPLSTNFNYNDTDNLVIAVDENTPDYGALIYWYSFTSGTNTGIVYRSDSTNPDPSNPPTATSRYGNINQIQLDMLQAGYPEAVTNPNPINNALNVPLSGNLTWTFGADTSTYDLWLGPTGNMVKVVSDGVAGASGNYSYSGLTTDTEYSWQVISKNTNSRFVTNGPVWKFRTVLPEGMVQIGTGTATSYNLPINPNYGYNYSQVIYLQSEINIADKRISKIYYNWNGAAAGTNSKSWTVYLGHTTKTAFSGTSDWIPVDQMTPVFSGDVTLPASAGWVEIALTTPFIYNNSDNLVVAVDENTSGYDGYSAKFYNTAVSAARSLLYYNDSTNPDPASPPTASYNYSAIANIRMQFEEIPAQPVFTISPSATTKDFGSVIINTPATQKYTISNTGAGTLTISSIEVTGTYYSKSIDITDNALTAGESTDFTVQFLPTVAGGPFTGSVAITYDSSKDVYNISLTGTCYDPTVYPPWTENFDGVTAPALPTGWTYIDANNDAVYWKTSTSYPRSTPNSLYISYNSSMAMDDWVFSPPLSLNSGSTYIVEFYYRSSGYSPEKLKLMAGHSPSAAGMTETIIDLGSFMSATYLQSTNYFTPTSKGIYYLGWYGYSDMDEWYICIDDVSVTEAPSAPGFSIAPTSKDFGSVQIDQSSTPQIFTITNTGGGTLFIDKDDITISGTNATDFILTPVENDISLSGGATANITVTFKPTAFGTRTGSLDIIDNTAKKAVHHVSLTGSGYYPPVANKVNDFESGWGTTTAVNGSEVNQWCVGSATFSRSQSAYISSDGGTTNAYTITSTSVVHFYNDISLPPLTGGLYKIELSFDWKAEGEGSSPYYYDYLRVFLIDTASTPLAGTELTSGQIGSTYNLHGTEWQNAKIDLSSYAGTTKRLVFSWRNDYSYGTQPPAAVDNIKIDYYYNFVPVELTSFTAVLSSEMFVNLSWVVASETNHLGYNVLRNTGNELNTAVRINKDIITEGQSTGTEVSYSFIDKETEVGQTYYYWLQNIDIDGSYNFYGPVTATVTGGPGGPGTPVIPFVNRLADAYPNPFISATTISYEIKEAGQVRIDIYNVRGQIVRSFTANHNKAGDYKIVWDGKDETGTQVSSGVYFYNMQFGKYHSVKKVLLTK